MKIIHTQDDDDHAVQLTIEDAGVGQNAKSVIVLFGSGKSYHQAHHALQEAIDEARESLKECRETIQLRVT